MFLVECQIANPAQRDPMWRSCVRSVEVENYKFLCSTVADVTSATMGNLDSLQMREAIYHFLVYCIYIQFFHVFIR